MKKVYSCLVAMIALFNSFAVQAQTSHLVISQVYGGGGNSGATLKNDFIEIFNPTSSTIDVSGWSVQYASSSGNTWQATNLSGSIAPGHYYLVQEAKGSGGTVNLPTPDASGSIGMSGTSGKVALVKSTTAISGVCPLGGNVIDFVGFGSSANCSEGSGPTATLSNTTAALRANDGCTDTDNNSSDFATGTPNPRNSASPAHLCSGGPSLTVSVNAGANASEPSTPGTFIITLSAPAPAGGVTVNYIVGGSATAGSDYAGAAGPGSVTIPEGLTSAALLFSIIDDAAAEGTETIDILLTGATNGYTVATTIAEINLLDNDAAGAANVVINQVYGGGGNSGATYTNDFIELYNNENVAVNLDGWSVQYLKADGTGTWSTTPLSGMILAHGFYLVQEAKGNGGSTALPTPDAIGSLGLSSTTGKVLLSNSITAQSGENPSGTSVIDKVGYGSSATGFETAAAPGTVNATAVRRVTDGVDHDDNSTDFIATEPLPRNSPYTTTAPVIVSLSPLDNSANMPPSLVPSFVFNKPVEKGTGTLTLFENGVALATIDVASSNVTITDHTTVSIHTTLTSGKTYYVLIDGGAFKDVYGNSFAGISSSGTWNFSTYNPSLPMTLPVSFNFQNCSGNGLLPDGFTQYSEAGTAVWDCTIFGRDASDAAGKTSLPNGVQINGFSNDQNVPNIDWLISPSLDLTGTTYPLLSFWSRTAFNGKPLQLKVSRDYTGGNPALATWTDVNGKFPAQGSDVWTLSKDINLAAFKGSNVHVAFVYISSDEEGARWTVDDISLINSDMPPPPSLTVGTTDIQFGYTAKDATQDKTFSFTGNDLTGGISLSASGAFLLSKDGSSFSPSIGYTLGEANNTSQTVHVRFAPTAANQNFTGTVSIATSGLSSTVGLKGTSIDPATTLEVVNWNMEWFGSTDPSLGPTNDDLQQQNAETVLKAANADIYGLVEVVDEARLAAIVSRMPGYSYVICNYGSHVNPPDPSGGPVSQAQKEAFVYKTSLFTNVNTRPLINNQDITSKSYDNWSSGRYPFIFTADVTLNCETKRVNFVLIHAKANTSPTATSYARRQAAATELHDTLNLYFGDANVVVLGDFNDDLDQSITAGKTVTSYSAFTTDAEHFFSPTLELSLGGKQSTASFNDVIDHVVLSNEMAVNYLPSSASILTDVASEISKYSSTTSDHYPVLTRYMFRNTSAPVVSECPTVGAFCSNKENYYSIPVFTAADDCGDVVSYSYVITGATERSGSGNDASGAFNIGTSTITWMAMDSWENTSSCQTTVVVNETPAVILSDSYVLPQGVEANTVYTGYAPAAALSVTAQGSGGDGTYHYSWTAGEGLSLAEGTANQPTVQVYATKEGSYSSSVTVTVTDGKGCTATATLEVSVVDVRSGHKMDKVRICHSGKELSVDGHSVQTHLLHGDALGGCVVLSNVQSKERIVQETAIKLALVAAPNPSAGYFTIQVQGATGPSRLQVRDILGRIVEQASSVPANQSLRIGEGYRPGVYFVEVSEGSERAVLKLVKQAQ